MIKLKKVNQILNLDQKKKLIKLLFIIFLVSILDLIGIAIFFPILIIFSQIDYIENDFISNLIGYFDFLNSDNILLYLIFVLFSVYLAKTLLSLFLNFFKYKILFGFYAQLSSRLMKIYINLRYSDFVRLKISEKSNTLKTEIEYFVISVIDPFLIVCLEILTIILITIFLLSYDPKLLLNLILFGSLVVFSITKFFSKKLKIIGKEKLKLNNQVHQQINQGLFGIKDIKLSLKEFSFTKKYSHLTLRQSIVASLIRFIQETPRHLIELLAISCFVSIIFINIFKGHQLSELVVKLGIFAAASFRILPSLNRIVVSINSIRQSSSVIDTIFEDMNLIEKIPVDSLEEKIDKNIENIKILNLNYKYPENNVKVINDINLEINLGDYIGIFGKSGSGKSTFINLFSGLIKNDTGNFFVNGKGINVNSKSWKENIGHVPQSIFLNNETVKENVAFGVKKEDIDDSKVIEVLKKVQLYDYVSRKKDGIDTEIFENSANLSGGQIQRIGIARALYRDPKILIFDESTNSLDMETEKKFMETVNEIREDKIIIFVTHKVNLLKYFNKIYEFENNRLNIKKIDSKN